MPASTEQMEKRIVDLERRLAELEGTVGFVIPTMREVHRAMLSFRDDAIKRLDRLEKHAGTIDARLDLIDNKVESLPRAMAETVSESEHRVLAAIEKLSR
jgi:hypothetical protein